ncbi:hypothetical protein [Deinococcus sedimenti]|uniref:Uncharacterized protein n=1 Tax=Deinococcus sedimenti TaxID=1867090 RepID=A0ABQ2S9L4_9DEIO|nr:hypothetical protein [Deinococcus sedimenti]GGS11410.1 hypothetical protein GCM10008960_41670 [Deinococcus sedimenti]
MSRAVWWPAAILLGAALTACGAPSSPADPTGGRPPLPSGVEVRFPAAPANAYLSLVTAQGESVYQVAVPVGKTATDVDPLKWMTQSARAVDATTLIPAGASVTVQPVNAKVLLLEWLMWQDRNANGTLDVGEALPLMTHDRVAYASGPVTAEFTTVTPNMRQRWMLAQGWSRAEHYVYLPLGSATYQRSLSTATIQRYTLHEPTPLTSQ